MGCSLGLRLSRDCDCLIESNPFVRLAKIGQTPKWEEQADFDDLVSVAEKQ